MDIFEPHMINTPRVLFKTDSFKVSGSARSARGKRDVASRCSSPFS